MRAIRIHEFGGIDTMRLDEIPRSVPAAGEVLVAAKAAGVGPWDRLIREGRSGLGQALPLILGSEVSGTVAALGAGVGVFGLGDAVYGATSLPDARRGKVGRLRGPMIRKPDSRDNLHSAHSTPRPPTKRSHACRSPGICAHGARPEALGDASCRPNLARAKS